MISLVVILTFLAVPSIQGANKPYDKLLAAKMANLSAAVYTLSN